HLWPRSSHFWEPRGTGSMLEPLLERFRHGDRRALAPLLTLVARGEGEGGGTLPAAPPPGGGPPPRGGGGGRGGGGRERGVVAVTGGGGVGKSSLIGKLIELLRSRGRTVAVLACDPQSPLTGGALLADRVRMPTRPEDPGVFIRSMTAPSGHEGIAEHLEL